MDLDSLSPLNRALLLQALPEGRLVNVLYDQGARVEDGFARETAAFAGGLISSDGKAGRPRARTA